MSIICTTYEQTCVLNPLKTMCMDGDWMHINAQTAQEVMTQCGYVNHGRLRLCVYANCETMFLDAEGSAELCRLLHIDQKMHCKEKLTVPVLPCDYSICMLASTLNIECVEVVLGHPLFENGIMRPEIMKHIVRDTHSKVIAGGVFTEHEVQQLMSWGCVGVHQYQREAI